MQAWRHPRQGLEPSPLPLCAGNKASLEKCLQCHLIQGRGHALSEDQDPWDSHPSPQGPQGEAGRGERGERPPLGSPVIAPTWGPGPPGLLICHDKSDLAILLCHHRSFFPAPHGPCSVHEPVWRPQRFSQSSGGRTPGSGVACRAPRLLSEHQHQLPPPGPRAALYHLE